MIGTPISDRNNLSIDSKAEYTKEDLSQWAYELGLKLDKYISLHGATNCQRIEKAIQMFVESKAENSLISGVRLSLPDADNYDYLRGFIDGYGWEEHRDCFPDGFKDINDVLDRVYELKGNEA